MNLKFNLFVSLLAIVGFAMTANAGSIADQDTDLVPDVFDSCPFFANGPGQLTNQVDTDADGRGNRCDADFDGDDQALVSDFGLMLAKFPGAVTGPDLQFDMDGDGQVLVSDIGLFLGFFPGPLCPVGELNPGAPNCP